MARIDIGQVLLAIAALRILDGAIRVEVAGCRWWCRSRGRIER
jgi:hypothetical protein